jgi:hypothetical protein
MAVNATENTPDRVEADRIEQVHCSNCAGKKNQFIRREYIKHDSDEETSWSYTTQILECCGCGNFFRKS